MLDDRIIVIGGMNIQGGSIRDVTAYDPISNSWTALTPLPTARHSGVAGSTGNKIFYAGGNGFKTTTYQGVPVLVSPPIGLGSASPKA